MPFFKVVHRPKKRISTALPTLTLKYFFLLLSKMNKMGKGNGPMGEKIGNTENPKEYIAGEVSAPGVIPYNPIYYFFTVYA